MMCGGATSGSASVDLLDVESFEDCKAAPFGPYRASLARGRPPRDLGSEGLDLAWRSSSAANAGRGAWPRRDAHASLPRLHLGIQRALEMEVAWRAHRLKQSHCQPSPPTLFSRQPDETFHSLVLASFLPLRQHS